jgi:hypothetical protein
MPGEGRRVRENATRPDAAPSRPPRCSRADRAWTACRLGRAPTVSPGSARVFSSRSAGRFVPKGLAPGRLRPAVLEALPLVRPRDNPRLEQRIHAGHHLPRLEVRGHASRRRHGVVQRDPQVGRPHPLDAHRHQRTAEFQREPRWHQRGRRVLAAERHSITARDAHIDQQAERAAGVELLQEGRMPLSVVRKPRLRCRRRRCTSHPDLRKSRRDIGANRMHTNLRDFSARRNERVSRSRFSSRFPAARRALAPT